MDHPRRILIPPQGGARFAGSVPRGTALRFDGHRAFAIAERRGPGDAPAARTRLPLPEPEPAFRWRLWRAAIMGIAGGLTGLAIGAALYQFGPAVEMNAPPLLREIDGRAPVAAATGGERESMDEAVERAGAAGNAGGNADTWPLVTAIARRANDRDAKRLSHALVPATPGIVASARDARCTGAFARGRETARVCRGGAGG